VLDDRRKSLLVQKQGRALIAHISIALRRGQSREPPRANR
jgi:hypothetical protein